MAPKKPLILADVPLTPQLGVSEGFVINSHIVQGDQPYAVFKKAINRVLRGE